jgi:hypothetical protein
MYLLNLNNIEVGSMMMEVYKISKKRSYTKTLNKGNADKRYCKKVKQIEIRTRKKTKLL